MFSEIRKYRLLIAVAVASAAAVFAFGDVALEVGKHAEPRFVLTLSKAPSNKPVEVVSSNAVSSSVRETSGVFRYEWKFAAGAPVESASATVRCSDDETRYRFQVKVADGWHLEKRAFPEIQCPLTGADGAQKWFMTGRANGGYGHGCAMYSSNGNGAMTAAGEQKRKILENGPSRAPVPLNVNLSCLDNFADSLLFCYNP